MLKKIIFFFMIAAAGVALGQGSSRSPDNKELVNRAKSLFIRSDTFFMKREQLESSMLGRAEFKAWDLQVTNKKIWQTCWCGYGGSHLPITSATP